MHSSISWTIDSLDFKNSDLQMTENQSADAPQYVSSSIASLLSAQTDRGGHTVHSQSDPAAAVPGLLRTQFRCSVSILHFYK